MKTFTKDPDSTLDYVWDWTEWLSGDTITNHSITVPADINLLTHTRLDGKVTGWFSGGTVGKSYTITCEIVTDGGRTDQRSARLVIKDL